MNAWQGAAISLWLLSAGFGLPAIPVAIHLLRRGDLPTFFGLFHLYSGPFFERSRPAVFAAMLGAFFVLAIIEASCGLLLWRESDAGAVLALLLLPVESFFWFGFALPIPPLFGIIRVVFLMFALGVV